MTKIEDFLKQYPAWPKPLAERFINYLGYGLADSDEYKSAKLFYDTETAKVASKTIRVAGHLPWSYTFDLSLLNPKNARFTKSASMVQPISPYADNIEIADAGFHLGLYEAAGYKSIQPVINVAFDSRIFSSVSAKVLNRFVRKYGPYSMTYMSIMTYTSVNVYGGESYLDAIANGTVNKFSGSTSINALIENEIVPPGINIVEWKEFYTYLQAYNKYVQQIESSAANAKARASDEFKQYEQGLISELRQEQSQLENLAISTGQQMQSEAATIQRDIISLTLQAQMLANQLQGQLKL